MWGQGGRDGWPQGLLPRLPEVPWRRTGWCWAVFSTNGTVPPALPASSGGEPPQGLAQVDLVVGSQGALLH